MLKLTIYPGRQIHIGNDIVIEVLRARKRNRMTIGIHAPEHVRIRSQAVLKPAADEDYELLQEMLRASEEA